jgi:hypothetical protein
MELSIALTEDERHACRRAVVYVRGIAEGLRGSSDKDAAACARYASTLEAISGSADSVQLQANEKIYIEQASFLLEGIRNGLDNADLDTAADMVQRDIERLNDLVFRYNSEAGRRTV